MNMNRSIRLRCCAAPGTAVTTLTPFRPLPASLAVMALAASFAIIACTAPARAEDGYSSAFAQAVRAATQPYRLVVWARNDQYIQSTDFVGGIGMMYTNHERFNPPDLGHPSMLVYDESGRLFRCGHHFTLRTPY